MYCFKFSALLEEWDLIAQQLTAVLQDNKINRSDIRKIMMALEELVLNIIAYGAQDRVVNVELKLIPHRERSGGYIEIILEDDGMPFNPLAHTDRNVVTSSACPAGGWGIDMARHLMDNLEYTYENGRNHLYMEKR